MTTLLLDGSVVLGLASALNAATVAYVAVIAATAKSAARRRDARETLSVLRHRRLTRPRARSY